MSGTLFIDMPAHSVVVFIDSTPVCVKLYCLIVVLHYSHSRTNNVPKEIRKEINGLIKWALVFTLLLYVGQLNA